MSKVRIFLWHAALFLTGAASIAGYFWYKIAALPANQALAGVALIPVAGVYIVGFGILCLVSLALFLAISAVRRRMRSRV